MTVDPRCLIATDLGVLLDGSGLSEDHAQEIGLVTYRGTFIFDGVLTPARGRVIQTAYARPQYGASGLLTRFYPRLHVISSSANPFANQTTVEVGCRLALMSERRDPIVYRAIDHPPAWWSALTADRRAVVPPTIAAQGVIQFCLDQLGITLAAGSATSPDTFLRDEIDLSGGYVQVLNDLLKDALLVGHMTPAGELLVRPVTLEAATGPVLTRDNLISLQPINDRAGAEQVTVEFDAFEAPNNADPGSIDINSDEQKLRDWEYELTIGAPQEHTIVYYGRVFNIGAGVEEPLPEPAKFTRTIVIPQISEVRTDYRTINYTDADGRAQSQDVVTQRRSDKNSGVSIAIGQSDAFFYPPSGAIPWGAREVTTYAYEVTPDGPRVKQEETFSYESALSFFTSLPIGEYTGETPLPNGERLKQRRITTFEVDEASGLTKRYTVTWDAVSRTQSGSQAAEGSLRGATTSADYQEAYEAAKPLILTSSEVSTNLGRQSGLQSRPSAQARQRDVLSGAFRDDISLASSGQVATSYGQREPQTVTATYAFGGASPELWNTATYRLTYAPDDSVSGVNGTTAGIVDLTLLRGNARARALEFGRIQNAIEYGHANGVEVTTAPWELPSAPFAPVYIDVSGLSTAFRVHGRNWAIANGAMVVTADLMLVGTAGRITDTPVAWMPITSDPAGLNNIGAPTGSGEITPANTITLPGGFDPVAPGSVWASLPTNGSDSYGPRRTPTNIAPPYVQTVPILARSRSGVVVTELLYSVAPVTEAVLAVSRSKALVAEVTAVVVPAAGITAAPVAPIVSISAAVRPPAATITGAALAPFVTSGGSVTVPTGAVAIEALLPEYTGRPKTSVLIPAAGVTVAALMPAIASGASISAPSAGVTVAGLAPSKVGAPFGPASLSPVAWWDASDAATITTSGGDITDWNDKSGNGWHLSQSTAGDRPAYTTAAVNGLNAAEWPTGFNTKHIKTGTGTFAWQEMYAVVRFGRASGFANYEGLCTGANGSDDNGWAVGSLSTGWFFVMPTYLNANNSTDRQSNLFAEIESPCLIRLAPGSTRTTASGVVVGGERINTSLGRGWKGLICEIVFISTALGTADRGDLENYLINKWGI